jgi:PIN domain nuclease of toxin-antitoxin system
MIQEQQSANDLRILPVELHHVYALDALPLHHKDPFDRVLIAQAQANRPGLSAPTINSSRTPLRHLVNRLRGG